MTAFRRAGILWLGLLALQAGPAFSQGLAPEAAVPFSLSRATDPLKLAAWASASGDASGKPFVIVDKLAAQVFAFDGEGVLVGSSYQIAYPVLIWWTRDGEMKACACEKPQSFGYIRKDLGVS